MSLGKNYNSTKADKLQQTDCICVNPFGWTQLMFIPMLTEVSKLFIVA